MAIREIVTGGYGNGTFNSTIALVVLRGYVLGIVKWVPELPVTGVWTPETPTVGTWTPETPAV